VSSLLLPEQSKLLVNGVTISLVRANLDDAIHCESVGRELRRVITNDAKEHGVEYDERNFAKVLAAYRHNRIQAYFLIVDRECCEPIKESPTPLYAGGAVQFPTVITEWNGHSFEHFHAIYSEDTWVDRHISDEVRALTKGREFPRGVGLGTFNTQGRIMLSASGSAEHNARGRISETAADNAVQLAIFSKLGVSIDLPNGAVIQFDSTTLIEPSRTVTVKVSDFAFQNANNASVSVLPYVFLTPWSNSDGSQQIVGTHTQGISTVSANTIIRSQFTSNGNLPPPNELRNIMTEMVSVGRAEAREKEWAKDDNGNAQTLPIMRVHAYGREMVDALKAVGGKPRHFGFNKRNEPHFMAPAVINYTQIPNTELRSKLHASKPLMVITRQPTG
jgi:hypothetical protein